MVRNEKMIFLAGTGAGILVAVIAIGAYTTHQLHTPSGIALQAASATTSARADKQAADEASGTQPGATVELTPDEVTAAGVQVTPVRTARLRTDIEAFGRVEQPEAQLAAISARIGGRIDKLYVQYTGETVRRGQPIAELYSPEVANAVSEYHLASEYRDRLLRSDDPEAQSQAGALLAASQRKLELWGISAKQIEEGNSSGIPHVTIYASASGTVMERKATQGQYVTAGDTLFTVADLSHVWIKADVYESQLPEIRSGQSVDVTSDALPNLTIHGRVDFIEPTANPLTRTVPVHVHVANPGMRLVPGMFVRAQLLSRAPQETIVVPRSAVLDTGTRKIVYIATGAGTFEAREVIIGAPSDDLFPVSSGLKLGDKVVLAGNFLIDSQTRLSSGMSGLYGGSKEFGADQRSSSTSAPTTKIAYHVEPEPAKGGADGLFTVTLADADGKPIPDAQVTVTLVMPAMPSMNMPEMRNSFDLRWDPGHQSYAGSGRVPMAGSWNVTVVATKNGQGLATTRGHLAAK
jgi:membrane fusion protein, copper/silver efflux system